MNCDILSIHRILSVLSCCTKNGCIGCKKPHFLYLLKRKKYSSISEFDQLTKIKLLPTVSFLHFVWGLLRFCDTGLISYHCLTSERVHICKYRRKNLLLFGEDSSSYYPFLQLSLWQTFVFSLIGKFLWSSKHQILV